MSIRQTLRGWFRFLIVSFLMIGAFAQTGASFAGGPTVRLGSLGLMFAAVLTLFYFGFRCPRCTTSLLRKTAAVLSVAAVACPKCGTSVDEKR